MEFDLDKYKVYNWKSWWGILVALNPVGIVTELLFGKRFPAVFLFDKTLKNKRLSSRIFVPCPHCGQMHNHQTWSDWENTGYRNWFGLYCGQCGGVIPCMLSIGSLLILVVSYPFWGWFREPLKARWLAAQPHRYGSTISGDTGAGSADPWLLRGLMWGASFCVLTLFWDSLIKGADISIFKICLCLLFGLACGFMTGTNR